MRDAREWKLAEIIIYYKTVWLIGASMTRLQTARRIRDNRINITAIVMRALAID